MSGKSNLLKEIEEKAKRKEKLREEIATRTSNVEAFVLKMINDLEDMAINTTNTSLLVPLAGLYAKSLEGQIHTLDPRANVDVQWVDNNGSMRVNGILIKWSEEYQKANNCDAELFVDTMGLLLK